MEIKSQFLLLIIFSLSFGFLPEDIFSKGQRYLVFYIENLGLVNRLRILAGLYSIGRANDLNLLVIWKPSYDCAAYIDQIFDNYPPKFQVLRRDIVEKFTALTVESAFRDLGLKSNLTVNIVRATSFYQGLKDYQADIVIVWTLGTHAPINMPCHNYLFSKSLFYQHLSPITLVNENVQRIRIGHFYGNVTVGIHIR